jgi:uncharacterized Tic20 family protein
MGAPGQPLAPPAGWYSDPDGAQRWWDGMQWGPAAPVRSEVDDGKTLGIITHLGVLAAGFVLPLVIRLTEGKKNAYVRHHAAEALNFQITFMIAWIAGFVAYAIGLFGSAQSSSSPPAWVLIIFVTMMVLMLANFVFSILGAVRAGQGRWWRYPINIRFVRGARPKGEDQPV